MIRLDFFTFVKYLRLCPHATIRENLVRYALAPVLKRATGWESLPCQLELLRELLDKDSFVLIILDACRYDLFNTIYGQYLSGELIRTRSLGPDTYDWLPKLFALPEFDKLKFFSAKPAVKTHAIKPTDFLPPGKTLKVIDIWPRQGGETGTVLPEEVSETIFREGLADRNIVWYVQPHYPWVRDEELSKELVKEVTWRDFSPRDLIREKMRKKKILKERMVRAYTSNLHLVLSHLSGLLGRIKDSVSQIVVTSDHGELLGDYGLYLHPHLELSQLYVVPWLNVQI